MRVLGPLSWRSIHLFLMCLVYYPGDQSTLFLSEKSPLKSGNCWPLGQRVQCSKVAVPGDLLLFCSILFQQLDDANYK